LAVGWTAGSQMGSQPVRLLAGPDDFENFENFENIPLKNTYILTNTLKNIKVL